MFDDNMPDESKNENASLDKSKNDDSQSNNEEKFRDSIEKLNQLKKETRELVESILNTFCTGERFGDLLRTFRLKSKLKMLFLARMIGRKYASDIAKYESGSHFPRQDKVNKLIETLGLNREETEKFIRVWTCEELEREDI